MSPIRSFLFSTADVHQLRQALNDDRPEVRRKAQALLQVADGASKVSVARSANARSKTSVYNWIAQYRDGGIDGLASRQRQGRPRLATPEYQSLLTSIADMTPGDFGIELDGWTADALNRILQEKTGIEISEGRFRALLHSLGYQFQLVRAPAFAAESRPKTRLELNAWLEAIRTTPAQKRESRTWKKKAQ